MGALHTLGIRSEGESYNLEYPCCDVREGKDLKGRRRRLLQETSRISKMDQSSEVCDARQHDRQLPFNRKNKKKQNDPEQDPISAELSLSNSSSNTPIRPMRTTGGSFRGSGNRLSTSLSSWIDVPAPLNDWTKEEQQIFIDLLEEYPKAGRNPAQMEQALVRASKLLPMKTLSEFHRCFKHIQSSRIAYFSK